MYCRLLDRSVCLFSKSHPEERWTATGSTKLTMLWSESSAHTHIHVAKHRRALWRNIPSMSEHTYVCECESDGRNANQEHSTLIEPCINIIKRGMFTSKDQFFIITVTRRAHGSGSGRESAVIRAAGNRKIPRKSWKQGKKLRGFLTQITHTCTEPQCHQCFLSEQQFKRCFHSDFTMDKVCWKWHGGPKSPLTLVKITVRHGPSGLYC